MTQAEHDPLIVVGVDGSAQSAAVLAWAARQALAVDGRLRVVLAWHVPELPGDVPPRVESELSRAAEKVVAELLTGLPPGVRAEPVVQEASPVRLLLGESADADLLVLGSHGYGGDERKLMGSVAHSCVGRAACPVVIVPLGWKGPQASS